MSSISGITNIGIFQARAADIFVLPRFVSVNIPSHIKSYQDLNSFLRIELSKLLPYDLTSAYEIHQLNIRIIQDHFLFWNRTSFQELDTEKIESHFYSHREVDLRFCDSDYVEFIVVNKTWVQIQNDTSFPPSQSNDYNIIPLTIDLDQPTQTVQCRWKDCKVSSSTKEELLKHIKEIHIPISNRGYANTVDLNCYWSGCTSKITPKKRDHLIKHLAVHNPLQFSCSFP
ncbi:hypothetical protein HK096_005065, partial [Nowakowskiella sp. JEL0078]